MAVGSVQKIEVTVPVVSGIAFVDTVILDSATGNLIHVSGELDLGDHDLFNLYDAFLSGEGYDVSNLPEAT